MNRKLIIPVVALVLTTPMAWGTTHQATRPPSQAPSAAIADMSEGVVRKIDKDAGKITLKHGELKNLQMPAMSMVFRVKDPAMLEQVKVGDQVSFVAEKVGGQFTLTRIEPKQ